MGRRRAALCCERPLHKVGLAAILCSRIHVSAHETPSTLLSHPCHGSDDGRIDLGADAHAGQTLTGIVTDSAGRPLREAELLVGRGTSRTRSDSMGRYSIRLPRGGRVEVMVRLVGYRQFIDTVQVRSFGTQRFNIRLERLPTRLATVTVTDRSLCETTTLSGFECRRNSGVGHFRDAGELRAMRPRNWADMLDGMPGLRREPRRGPYGMDWRPTAPPSRCVREIWNGQLSMEAPEAEFQPDELWTPNDVVAIEYYESHNEVPPHYKRYAWWPPTLGQPCGLIVYWFCGADRGKRPTPGPR